MDDKSITKGLEQEARMVRERIPEQVTPERAKEVAESLAAFMAERNYTQAEVAKMLGLPKSTGMLNLWLSGKYGHVKGRTFAELINRAVNWMNSVARKEGHVKGRAYVETTIAKEIGALIVQTEAFTDDEGKIGLIIGDGGHGKSHCLRAYAKANRNTVYIELDDCMNSKLIFAEIAANLGLDTSGSLAAVTRRLIDNLANRHVIIMLDEASGLTVRQLNQLRQIIVVKSRCPLVLAGNRGLHKTVMQSTLKLGYESLDQLTSRLMRILDLDKIAADKDGGLYTAEDIRLLYEYGGVKLTGDGVRTLRTICRTPWSGRLRTCGHIIAALHASSAPAANTNRIDARLIVAAIEQLDLPVKVRLPLATGRFEETHEQAEAKAG